MERPSTDLASLELSAQVRSSGLVVLQLRV
jgi:hypothetical protein